MYVKGVKVSRIMIRDRGGSSEISIDADVLIQPDDAAADAIRQHMPENIRTDTAPARLQAAVAELFAACQERAVKQHMPTLPVPPTP